jgi:hypothetical protein
MTSVTALPGFVLRMTFQKMNAMTGETATMIAPGNFCPAFCPATHRLVSISQTVRPGRFTPKSAKISSNFGMMKYMIAVRITIAIRITAIG